MYNKMYRKILFWITADNLSQNDNGIQGTCQTSWSKKLKEAFEKEIKTDIENNSGKYTPIWHQ